MLVFISVSLFSLFYKFPSKYYDINRRCESNSIKAQIELFVEKSPFLSYITFGV